MIAWALSPSMLQARDGKICAAVRHLEFGADVGLPAGKAFHIGALTRQTSICFG